jgi:tungstate transport system substrate-binding protein
MGATLRQADERGAYTLTDDATFMQLQEQLTLAVLFSSDARLVNSYSVLYPRGNQAAAMFAEWLAVGNGRALIDAFRIGGIRAFTPWPSGCPADQPTSAPCKDQ